MPAFERLGLDQITVVNTAQQARHAVAQLEGVPVLGFDTESKPTFQRNETSDGPDVVQLATNQHGASTTLPGCSAWLETSPGLMTLGCPAPVASLPQR